MGDVALRLREESWGAGVEGDVEALQWSGAVAANAEQSISLSTDAEQALAAMHTARELTLGLVAGIDEDDLIRVHSPIMSPLVWDLGHIAAYEDLWLAHRHGGLALLRPELAHLYDAFETPRAVRGEIEALGP
ncbi:MAG: egtB, partial [Solirubrobacterales bacterium]|nr:egtB [Solirubrobacterales bacterium]